MRSRRTRSLALLVAVAGCATIQQVLALRDVDFALDRVADVRLAGIELDRVRSFESLALSDVARIASAVQRRDLPLELDLHVEAENPAENDVVARMVRMDWTLLLQGRETISGTFTDEIVLPPGEPTDVRIPMSLNLIEFFEGSGQDLVELALSLTGQGGAPQEVTLEATPTIDTALGPIRYPQPITIVSREVGQ